MSLGIEGISAKNTGKEVVFTVKENGEEKEYKFEKGLIAVGMTGNINGIGLESIGVKTDRGLFPLMITTKHLFQVFMLLEMSLELLYWHTQLLMRVLLQLSILQA